MTFNVPTSFKVAGFLLFANLTAILSKDVNPFPELEICFIESLYLSRISLKSGSTIEEKYDFLIKENIGRKTGLFFQELRSLFMTIHSLPFTIGFNGEAEVDSAFPFKICDESKNAESAFRGRKLIGKIHEFPSNLSGKIFYIICLKILNFI